MTWFLFFFENESMLVPPFPCRGEKLHLRVKYLDVFERPDGACEEGLRLLPCFRPSGPPAPSKTCRCLSSLLPSSSTLHLRRSFSKSPCDEFSVLADLHQCCPSSLLLARAQSSPLNPTPCSQAYTWPLNWQTERPSLPPPLAGFVGLLTRLFPKTGPCHALGGL